ncbi:MAG: class I SAM-dependent methyltransferase [bacterium]|nr:class I SAM-dependent methyltransferase [bacterium]MCP5068764.1 class I SAM-dependent methyltransferase [bacterium]
MRRDWSDANRNLWNDRVPIHVGSDFYGVEAFKAGAECLHAYEIDEVGELEGLDLVHLQCHFGMDTLACARRGARVTGLDLSEAGIAAARKLAVEIGIPARFVVANLYDAVEALGETYDVVYTGRGALNWLPDVSRWAEVVAALLRPGGFLYLNEFHPVTDMMADESFEIEHDYFGRPEGYISDEDLTYTETGERAEHTESHEWIHPTSAVITALLDVGFRIELFREHDFTVYGRFPFLEVESDGIRRVYRTPEDKPRPPFMYSIRARK